jgi:branched-chain amino acid transport system substrate-binding protein
LSIRLPSLFRIRAPRRARMCIVVLVCGVSAAPALADLRVVQVAPLSGPMADTGRLIRQGAALAIREANEQGGIHGQKIRYESFDDAYKVEETVRLVRNIAHQSDKPIAFLGLTGTSNVTALLKQGLIDEAGIPVVGVRSGAMSIRQAGHPLVYHLRASYVAEVDKLVEIAAAVGSKQFGAFYQDDDFGRDGLQAMQHSVARRKLMLAASASYERNATDVENAARTLAKANGLSAIVMISTTQATSAFVKAYRAQGGLAHLYTLSVNNAHDIVEKIGAGTARGLGIAQVVPSPFSGVLPVSLDYQKLLRKFEPNAQPTFTGMEGYLYGRVLVEALRRTGPRPTREALIRALESAPFEIGGYVIQFARHNHEGSGYIELTMIGANGKLIR